MASIVDQIRRYQVDPKRSLGQNFLIDREHLAHIIAAADLHSGDSVLEIGPGFGILTAELAAKAKRVVAVELDDRLIDVLRDRFDESTGIQIIHGDMLALRPGDLIGAPYKVVANLPYYITSAVLRHLLEAEPQPDLAVVMVQKEVAERICAAPGDLSLLAVGIQYYAHPEIVHHVPAGAFYPQPKVDSAVLRIEPYPTRRFPHSSPERYFTVVRAGFSQKRKQLANSLSAGLHLPKDHVREALNRASIDPRRRAETIDLDEWQVIVDGLANLTNSSGENSSGTAA